ncbi:MAG: dihydroxy-acid dehydratase, partial [Acidobacteriota bacterium]
RPPAERLPLTPEMLLKEPSGTIFGFAQNVWMGWDPKGTVRDQFLLLSTSGGLRNGDGSPAALGYHTGHWELIDLMRESALTIRENGGIPFAAFCTDPCDGRSQGTSGMMDSLPYRNDAAIVARRLIRSLPDRSGVLAIGTCDKGLPAMLLAAAGCSEVPIVVVPGGVTLPVEGAEDLGTVQTVGTRFAQGEISLDYASEMSCQACGSSGGGCQFLGTAASAQVIAEGLGLALPHSALTPSGEPAWFDLARRSALALMSLARIPRPVGEVLTDHAVENALLIHAAFGGYRASCLGGVGWPVGAREAAAGSGDAYAHQGLPDHAQWVESPRRRAARERLSSVARVDPNDVIMTPDQARSRGLTGTLVFPKGNLAPEGSVCKATAIDPALLAENGCYRHEGPARVFTSEADAIRAIKEGTIEPGDVLVLIGIGPLGTGMEEIYQITSALKFLPWGRTIPVITDGRFSGVSTGPCIGHVSPEALAGGPIGRIRDGDPIRIFIDRAGLEGTVELISSEGESPDELPRKMEPHPGLRPHPDLPADTRLWAALQHVSGGIWRGAVYDPDRIVSLLEAGQAVLGEAHREK